MEYILCHPCALVFVNNDSSHLTSEEEVVVNDFAKKVGILVHVDHEEETDCFECECCETHVDNEESHIFETLVD